MSFSLPDAPLLSGLLGDGEIAALFTAQADIAAMLRFEAALAKAQAGLGLVPPEASEAIASACAGFRPDLPALAQGLARDGVAVPELVRQLRGQVGEPHSRHVHFGATSQDAIDTSFVLRARDALAIFHGRLDALGAALDGLNVRFGSNRLTGRTRMQAAIEVTARDRIDAWRAPLARHLARLDELSPRLLRVQFGGAAGTLEKFADRGGELTVALAQELDLAASAQWHTERSAVVELAGWLSLVAGSLGKIGQDVALMAQNEIGEIALSGGGGSSAMPHKQNPVKAEALVAIARFCATLTGGMHQALVHEQERSGAAWTLEWMLLPQLFVAAGASTRLAGEMLASVERVGAAR